MCLLAFDLKNIFNYVFHFFLTLSSHILYSYKANLFFHVGISREKEREGDREGEK